MAEDLTSPAAKRSAELTTQVVNDQQLVIRTVLCGGDKSKMAWLYAAPKVTTKLASDVLKAILSGDDANEDETFQHGEKLTNDHYDRFVAAARTAQVAECPAAQGAARKWASKWVKVLDEQAEQESEKLQKLMSASTANPRKLFAGDVRLL